MLELWCIRGAALLYGAAGLCAVLALLAVRPRLGRLCAWLAAAGALLQLATLLHGGIAMHRWSPGGTHSLQAALALLVALLFLLVAGVYRTFLFGFFAMPAACLLLLPSALGGQRYSFPSAAVRSGWIAVHVASLLAADTALVFSLLASSLYFVQERRLKRKKAPGFVVWLPPLETMDRIAQSTLALGFVCMTLGLFAGSLIAQERVGASYFADPKVLLSFAMWLVYVVLLLLRQSRGLRGRQAMLVSGVTVLVVLSVWAANLLSTVHRYAAP